MRAKTGKRWLGVVVALTVTGFLAMGAAGRDERARTSQLTFKLDQYLCYSIEPDGQSSWPTVHPTVVVTDQFRPPRTTRISRPDALCNPASKVGGKPRNGSAHLLCYVSRYSKTFSSRQVKVEPLGTASSVLQVGRPTFLCLPSGKSRNPDVLPRLARGLDHFQCYPVTGGKSSPPNGSVKDQFGGGSYEVGDPIRLCNPATKTKPHASTPKLINSRDHLVCYEVTIKVKPRKHLLVRNQFGRLQLNTTSPKMLCLPSPKKEVG